MPFCSFRHRNNRYGPCTRKTDGPISDLCPCCKPDLEPYGVERSPFSNLRYTSFGLFVLNSPGRVFVPAFICCLPAVIFISVCANALIDECQDIDDPKVPGHRLP